MGAPAGGYRSAGRRRPPLLLLASSAVGAVLVLLPLGVTLSRALQVVPAEARQLLMRPLVAELLVNSIGLMIAATDVA